ncbi:MAG TPA: PAS domain S-box protein [Acidobacteriaceae bacterium]|nr:PAS domain S-box protein [Acidobacteriaceae bacterium]
MTERDKANILMVDDQPAKLLSYEAILKDLDENLIKASSARQALEQLLANDVALILMDVSMPEMDGFELADMIRQHPRFQKTAIIFISAVHLTDGDRIKGYQSGAVDYISVPVVPELLRAKVSLFTELHRKSRQLERLNQELERRVEERTEQLQESESQFRALANSIPQLAWMANARGSIFWYNQRWYEFMGARYPETQEWGWRRVQHPDHVMRVMKQLEHAWEAGELWEDTFPLLNKENAYRWFLCRAVPIRDSRGVVVRWFGTATDITDQIAAEEKIRVLNSELEQRVAELETIMQVLPVGVAVSHSRDCSLVTGNTALGDLLGFRAGDNLAEIAAGSARLPFGFYQNGRRLEADDLPLHRAARTGQMVGSMELEVRRNGGGAIHLLASATPLFGEDGAVRGAVGAFFDVTARKQLEDLLRERADLLELATEAIMVRDRSGLLQFWNSGAEALYGWSSDEVLGKPIHEILQSRFSDDADEVEMSLKTAGAWNGNVTQMTRDGEEIVVESRQALKAHGGAILEINRDITAQLRAEEALRKNERLAAMGRVAGIIAHEINNPLEAITNTFYLLRDHPSLDDEARRYARLGEEELLRVSHITRQTLGFYRESKDPVPVSLSQLLDDILELQARPLEFNGIQLERQYRSRRAIYGFPLELKQVFLNLISNGIQAMQDGGRLRLRVFDCVRREDMNLGVCVSVCDTGTGIEPSNAKLLFEPFFTTKSTKGTGLGLWISKGIIQKYGGNIRFRSLRMGGGNVTCFRIFLPDARPSGLADEGDLESQNLPPASETVRSISGK